MQLLDASLAFVLTLAALATVVTTIMEACLRLAKMRKKNLITVMKLLNDEIGKGPLKMTAQERWDFFSKVVRNPAVPNKRAKRITWEDNDKNNEDVLSHSIESFMKRKNRKGIFNKVTLEYMLRCFSEIDTVHRTALEAKEMLQTELNRIARKYEEFGSAVSANFKQYAQAWSIAIGILLAIAANVDGVRIFEAYRADPKLCAAVIEKHENLIEKNKKVQAEINHLNDLLLKEKEITVQISVANQEDPKDERKIKGLQKDLKNIKQQLPKESDIAASQQAVQNAHDQVSYLVALGIPIGWKFYPNCPFGKSKEEAQWERVCKACKDLPKELRDKSSDDALFGLITTIKNDKIGFLIWLFKVIITGVLIGLGAPFWFDVAKRISMIRKGLKNPNSSAEDRLAARDANGDANKRKKIVVDVLSDICEEAAVFRNMSNTTDPKHS